VEAGGWGLGTVRRKKFMAKMKILKRIVIAVGILIVVLIAAAFFVLRSRAFHRFVLAEIVSRADQATEGNVQIGDFAFHLSAFRVDLYRIAFHSTEPNLGRLSLWVDHIGVSLKIISLLDRKIGLREIDIDRPVVHLVVSAEGPANLQPPPVKPAGVTSNLFSMAADRVILDGGEIYFNDRVVPVQAVLRGLQAQAGFDARSKQYDGALAYGAGEIQLANYRPVAHSLKLRFSANAEGMRANPLVIRTAESSASIRAALKNYSHPVVNGSYSVKLAAAEAARVVRSTVRPTGEIRTSGSFSYTRAPNRPLFDSVSLNGIIGSPRLSVRLRRERGQVSALRGQYRLERGNLTVNGLEADLFGGRLAADASLRNLAGDARGTLTASLRSVSIGALRNAVPNNRWAKFPVDGSLNATAQASWQGALNRLRVSSDATLSGAVMGLSAAQNVRPTPLRGTIHAVYDAQRDALTVRQAALQTPQSEIDLNGSIGRQAALTIEARSRDLRETDQLVTEVREFAGTPSAHVQPLGVSGSASFQGAVQGPLQTPRLTGQIAADNLRVQQASFPHLQALVSLSASKLALTQGELKAAQGSAGFQASVTLRKWAYSPSLPISLQLAANRMSLAALASVARLRYPVNGILSAQISIHGSPLHPEGSGTVQIARAEAWKQPIQNVTMRFHGNGTAVESTVVVHTQGGNVIANVTYSPQSEGYQGRLNASALNLGRLHVLQVHQVSGIATASVQGQGTLKAPQLAAKLSIPTLRLGQQTIRGVSAQMTVANRVATLTFSSNFAGIPAHASGTVDLTGNYQAAVNFSTGKIEAGPLLSSYLPGSPANIQCETQVKASLRGPLKDQQRLQARVEIPSFRLGYQSLHVSSVSAISADYQNGFLVFKPAEIKGTGTDFHFQASVPVKSNGLVSGSANGTVDLHLAQLFEPGWTISGQLQVTASAHGVRSAPQIQGETHIVNAALVPPNGPLGVQNINGAIAFTSKGAEITQLTGQSGGGSLSASGSVSYTRGMQFDLAFNANRVRLSYPQGIDEVLASRLRLLGTERSALLSGQVTIDNLFLSPQFDLMSVTNKFNVVSTPAGPGAGLVNHIKLNVAVRSSHELTLISDQLSVSGAADLRVQGTLDDPVVVGRVSLASGGSLLFNGTRYRVENGTINFVNPVMTEPVLDIRIGARVNQYDVTLNFTGPVDRMRTTYTSSPPLAPADIISLLISGHPTETPGATPGAESILAQGLGLGSGRVLKMAGLASLTIDPSVGGYQTNPGVNIAMQKQVTKNLFFTFSVNTSMSQDDTVQVQYQVTHRWSVEALRDPDGGYTLEVRSRKTF
jgi:translocation and assembly module TamB